MFFFFFLQESIRNFDYLTFLRDLPPPPNTKNKSEIFVTFVVVFFNTYKLNKFYSTSSSPVSKNVTITLIFF